MTEAERGDNATLFPQPVGDRLRAAREQQGMSLAEIGARTRVPLRHLEAIEASNYGALPSPTYAVGFVRAYARAVGEDEVALARDVRVEALKAPRTTPQYQPYEIADPARVPSRGLVVVAAGLALAVAVLAVLWFASGLFRGGDDAPEAAPSVAVAVPAAQPTQAARRADQVSLVATDEVWLRVYDAADKTLYLGTMKPGDRYDVPADANDPKINVGRPDKLQVTLNGSALPPLGSGARPIKDVPVGAAALTARMGGEGAPAPVASPASPPAVVGARTSTAVPPAFATSAAGAAGAETGAGTSAPAN
ncbi:helix-turn-helix domain-containing protein [Sphingomonas sp. ABOLG]|uniref:helix-turn-helix domain-containing protein n=1 Tax=Sphingomonas sp. ABOLG TaxID=1985880 RepID=UPI000F7F7F0E|nr:helix-turn-helix domain-containing protein [Sphingomonas sp. ABOLG]RSV18425.1 helix-turn-helix domain-containing protein [Sphingomonas sp. ABOLG]